jgi:hypothetical protein
VLFIQEVRATLGSAAPARFYFAAGDCLEGQRHAAQALELYDGLVDHPEGPVAARSAARRARLRKKLDRAGALDRPDPGFLHGWPSLPTSA